MKTLFSHDLDILSRALRAALASHRPSRVRELLAVHGAASFAAAAARLTPRAIDDALSMLAPVQRQPVTALVTAATRVARSTSRAASTRQPNRAAHTRGGTAVAMHEGALQ